MIEKLFRGIILGAPGSGKGTISARIIRDFKLNYLSVGDLLREHISNKTEVGLEAHNYISNGKLVPDLVVNKLVINELKTNFEKKSFLVDGYPRTLIQAQELWSYDNLRPNGVINLIVPDDEIIERIKHRWIHLPSGRTYHSKYNPPKRKGLDDITGEELVQREDDKEHVVMQRLLAYKQQAEVITQFFRLLLSSLKHYCISNAIDF
jgi:adenylate kinase